MTTTLNIVGNNGIFEDRYEADDPLSEPPLGAYAIGAMIKMAEEVCTMIGNDVEGVAAWAEKHARYEEAK